MHTDNATQSVPKKDERVEGYHETAELLRPSVGSLEAKMKKIARKKFVEKIDQKCVPLVI